MRILLTYSFIFIFFLFSGNLWADILYDASVLERDGLIEESILLYDEWLSGNSRDERFSEVLFHSASLIPNVEKTIQFLFKFENSIKDNQKQKYYLRLAQIYELLFDLSNASIYYGIASKNPDGNRNYEIYLKHLQLEYQMGNIPDTGELNNILLSNTSTSVRIDVLIFKAEILKYSGELRSAESLLLGSEYKNGNPEIYFALWEIYLLQNNITEMEKIVRILKSDFPDSVELSVIEGRIKRLPRLSDFFNKKEESSQLSFIQIGTFSQAENIRIQSELLEQYGFDFFYIENGKSTKIVVSEDSPADKLLDKLRSKGFDGFRIDYP